MPFNGSTSDFTGFWVCILIKIQSWHSAHIGLKSHSKCNISLAFLATANISFFELPVFFFLGWEQFPNSLIWLFKMMDTIIKLKMDCWTWVSFLLLFCLLEACWSKISIMCGHNFQLTCATITESVLVQLPPGSRMNWKLPTSWDFYLFIYVLGFFCSCSSSLTLVI